MTALHLPLLSLWESRRLPVLLKTESAESGLACLAIVASHHGHRIDLPGMRRRFKVSLNGATLKSLIALAEACDLKSRLLSLEHL
jgi:ATP-binding cassette subfamily B protein RaxB